MIAMKAPHGVLSLSVAGSQFPVVNGVVQVPPPYVRHALVHGCELLDSKKGSEILRGDYEAALAKAEAALVVSGMQAKPGVSKLSIEGVEYTVGEDGYVQVPSSVAGIAKLLGCTDAPLRKVDNPDEPSPFTDKTAPRDAQGLRLDGPTLEQFVKAGYKAENYPPEGYADKRTAEEQEAATAAKLAASQGGKGGGAGTGATPGSDGAGSEVLEPLPALKDLKNMGEADLRAWLKANGTEMLGDATRKQLNTAAEETLARVTKVREDTSQKKD